jgi:Fic/DOC family
MAGEVFGRLARDRYLRGLSREAFVDRLTELFADINALHPFREGNSRAQRALLTQLARDAGYPATPACGGFRAAWSSRVLLLPPDDGEAHRASGARKAQRARLRLVAFSLVKSWMNS